MDPIKEAFSKVKQDMDYLKFELEDLKQQISDLKDSILNNQSNQPTEVPTQHPSNQSNQHITPTHNLTELSKQAQYGLISPNSSFSTGNEGVPTNQPTNQQTNQHIGNRGVSTRIDNLQRASEILNSLDDLKKEVRIKFKKLTDQEMVIFSAIYTFDELKQNPDYSLLAKHLNLTEISIRDYVRKIISKGIPLDKTKENNKKITLSIPSELKRIATLQTILQLREI
ncbi:MAG: hypothetical protein AABW79_02145 [Nanoarchaeota archaeon]